MVLLIAGMLELTPPDESLLQRAITLAYEMEISVYDATYVALAQERFCPLIMADLKPLKKEPYPKC